MAVAALSAPLRIGVVCYPTYGGSGVIATEVGIGMAERGHAVHFIGYDEPRRLRSHPNVAFHGVEVRDYPVFHHPPYILALASRIVDVATWHGLDIIHVHYAIPHATAAIMARQVLQGDGAATLPRIVTTLHGTDITVVGSDPGYLPITRHALRESDAVTVPGPWLGDETRRRLAMPNLAIDIIPNFVDALHFKPSEVADATHEPLLVHVSNFRPVKRVCDVVDTFARAAEATGAALVMVGDGPDRPLAEARVRHHGLQGRVRFAGRQDDFVDVLQRATAFILPSETESFGVAALEAMACGVPVIASATGGLPELVVDGETGFLAPIGDIDAFAAAFVRLSTDAALRATMGAAARARAAQVFGREAALDQYEGLYTKVCQTDTGR
jgi:N-acetyl-alpha-D-glucosaminyl L-malate synthase BshA